MSDGVAIEETERLISSAKVAGTSVYDTAGESVGAIDSVMIDKRSGQVEYAVLRFGGFLGIGERYHPLPWRALTYDTRLGGYVVDIRPGQLDAAPSYAADEAPWATPGYGRSVGDYWGIPSGAI